MGNLNTSQVLVGLCRVRYGTAGSVARTLVGFTTDGCRITTTEEATEIVMDQSDWPLSETTTSLGGTVTFNFGEASLENMEAAMQGVSLVGSVLTFGDATNSEVSLRIEGVDSAGTERIWTIPYARAGGNLEYPYTKGEAQIIPASFKVLKRSGYDPITITDVVDNTTTLATGVMTRTASQIIHIVEGEVADTADTLTSIAGASLVDGEYIVLRLSDSENEPITLTHSATLVLTGAIDWTMNHPYDELVLRYTAAGTIWTEVDRVEA